MKQTVDNIFYECEADPLLLVISGPSGVGKDALVAHIKQRGVPFHFVVTATSRPQRPNEVDGVDYFFLSKAEFESMIEQGEFLEYAFVYGDYKGIPKRQIREALESGKDVVMRIDVQGAATIKQLEPEAVFIFLTASEEELLHRLTARHTESSEELQRRLAALKREFDCIDEFDYAVANRQGRLDEAVDKILAIITAEKCRVHKRRIRLAA